MKSMGVKPGFMVYHKAADLLCNLPDEACGILFKSLVLYSRDGVTSDFSEHPFSVFLDAIFSEQKKLIDEDAEKYRKMCEAQTARINSRWHKNALPDSTTEYHGIPGNTTEYRRIPQGTNLQYANILSTRNTPSVARKGKQFSVDSEAYKAASWLAEQLDSRKTSGKPESEETKQRWAADFDKCNRLDGHPWEEIESVLLFCQSDAFWKTNIRSGAKFRAQYDALHDRMEAAHDRTG